MKASVYAQTSDEARRLARQKLGTDEVYISCVLFVKTDPTIRQWVFKTGIE